jgi:hypothetical protein
MMAFHSAQAMIAGIEKDALCDPLMCFGFYR